jgi:hypothetical protein
MQVIEAQYLDHWGLTITSISNMCERAPDCGRSFQVVAGRSAGLPYPAGRSGLPGSLTRTGPEHAVHEIPQALAARPERDRKGSAGIRGFPTAAEHRRTRHCR